MGGFMNWEFELVAGPYGGTSEGPAWDGQAMLFTDIPNSRIMRYDPESGECSEYRTGTRGTNGLMFDAEGSLYGCSGEGRCILRFYPDGTSAALPH
ncbi:MAG: SMP-30/gluconolactonase/LRE family protein, partial [SAR202 cluster bacterium]|nr:SMP-30/gluconolactonase/LRE family protein [SAR202 cluster bacterium]